MNHLLDECTVEFRPFRTTLSDRGLFEPDEGETEWPLLFPADLLRRLDLCDRVEHDFLTILPFYNHLWFRQMWPVGDFSQAVRFAPYIQGYHLNFRDAYALWLALFFTPEPDIIQRIAEAKRVTEAEAIEFYHKTQL